ncbi:hypothetical protein EXT48_09880 [Pseudoalteromonas sp. CO348]|uniref:hypothetical protein n=1 Tax=unclassified Pseudoalteromonas TaxID=194690 RepID=UPI001023F00D|nr:MULTISPECIES: hypothetical protein [unclassified Pseudoalteromonas]MCG7540144.1 hypothetical protein [Pseudoalteromonas sp. OF7H-1]RZG05102.1 hypothetical protein EXT48_09880 [Pseudoalteromonas sp. CO348]
MKVFWLLLIVLQFTLLATFLVVSSLEPASSTVHPIVGFLISAVFVVLLVVPLFVCIKLKKNFFVAIGTLLFLNVIGSVILYFLYKKEMGKI